MVTKEIEADEATDLLIARQFMGWRLPTRRELCAALNVIYNRREDASKYYVDDDGEVQHIERFKPTRRLADAMQVLAHWEGDCQLRRQNDLWEVTLFRPSEEYEVWAATLPLAICRAALNASRLD